MATTLTTPTTGLYEELGQVADKPILLSGLYVETGWVSYKPILLSGLYEKQGWVADKKAEMRLRSGKLLKMQGLIDIP